MSLESQIDVQDLDHLGIIAGIVDDIGIVEIIDRELGKHPQEKVSAGQASDDIELHGILDISPIFVQ